MDENEDLKEVIIRCKACEGIIHLKGFEKPHPHRIFKNKPGGPAAGNDTGVRVQQLICGMPF